MELSIIIRLQCKQGSVWNLYNRINNMFINLIINYLLNFTTVNKLVLLNIYTSKRISKLSYICK